MPDNSTIESTLYAGKMKVKFLGPTPEVPNRHMYYVDGKRKTGVTTIIGIKDKSQPLVSWATELAGDYLLDISKAGGKISEKEILEAIEQHSIKKQEAADIGSVIHDWCEHYIKHKLKKKGYETFPELPEDKAAVIGINAFLDWEKEHKVKFVSSERVIYSKKHDYIGKMDIEAKVGGELCLIDLKSSNGLYNTVQMQTAAYVKADEEESGREYKGRWAIRLAKETEEEYNARMAKKNDKRIKRGKDLVNYPAYQVFEAKYLDVDEMMMEKDFNAFKACLTLFRWDKETDYFQNK